MIFDAPNYYHVKVASAAAMSLISALCSLSAYANQSEMLEEQKAMLAKLNQDPAFSNADTKIPITPIQPKAKSLDSISMSADLLPKPSSDHNQQAQQTQDGITDGAYTNSKSPSLSDTPHRAVTTLVDPVTQTTVQNSYPLTVSSYVSLDEAQSLLHQVSPKLAAHEAAIAASHYQSAAISSIDSPVVFARAAANAYSFQHDIDLHPLKDGISTRLEQIEPTLPTILPLPPHPTLPNFDNVIDARLPDQYNIRRSGSAINAGVGVVWPIYSAGRSDALTKLMDARTQEASADQLIDQNELFTTLIDRYFSAQLAIIASYLRDDALDTLQQTDHMAQRLFEEGFISHVDRLEAQSALADARSEAIKARNSARLAMIALQRLLRTETRVRPTTPLFVSSQPLPDVSYFQNLALTHHPALQKVTAKKRQASQLINMTDTGHKPTVLLYGYGKLDEKPSWMAGVSATWQLWGGLDKGAALAANKAKRRQAELTQIDVSDNLLLLVEKNWHDVSNAQARYFALQSNVELAAEVLRLRQLGLQEGVNTSIEVVQAQTQYLKARTEQAQAANHYVQALAALLSSCGTPQAFDTYMKLADIRLPTLYQPSSPSISSDDS